MKVGVAIAMANKAAALLRRDPIQRYPEYVVFKVTQEEFELLQDKIQYVEQIKEKT